MSDATFHTADTPDGRPATEEEITALLNEMTTAADGTSYLDIYRDTRDQD